MKYAPLILGLSVLFCTGSARIGSAQQPGRDNLSEIQQVNGYTIRVVRMERGCYGYEISRGAEVLVHQQRNPFTGSRLGLQRKVDALNTATWVLQNIVMREQLLPPNRRLPQRADLSRPLPSSLAATLGVTLDRRPDSSPPGER
jgi:hypothetical protein